MIAKLISTILSVTMAAGSLWAAAPDSQLHPRTVYFTVGDYQDLLYTPLDSKASINAAFDVLHDKYDVKRVWWRGGQDEVWGNQFVIRDQSRRYAMIWNWWKDLQYRVVKTNALAVNAGHDRGVEVWMAYGLFDNGSAADVAFGGFPYAAEDKIRVDHPEWAPVNKYGTWRQGGPIEFAYPGARRAMVDYLTKYTVDGNYDGIAFLTYCENFSQRYEDEFGYSQPIVDEFKKRYDVDIRTQPFDHLAWAKLRGEYLTQFMRELHDALAKQGKKIAVSVDGKDPHWPCLWNVSGGVRTVGHLWMDIDSWVKNGLIDELNLYYPNTNESMSLALSLCKGTPVKVSVFGHTRGDLPADMHRIMTVNTELESGYDWDNYIDFPDENVTPQPPEAMNSDDVYARRRFATAIQKGKQRANASDLIPLLSDPDVYVRRAALRAMVTLNDSSVAPAIEHCLSDPENGVRWLAAIALGQLAAPECVRSVFDAVAHDSNSYQLGFVAVPELLTDLNKRGKLRDEDIQLLIARTADPNERVRQVAWSAVRALALAKTPGLQDAAIRCLNKDSDPYSRELALAVLTNVGPNPAVLGAVRQALLSDKDEVVQVRAASALTGLTRAAGADGALRTQSLNDLLAMFHQYDAKCQRGDKDWGWREVGNAIHRLGPDGEAALNQIMKEKDQRLADLAWRVLYLRQEDGFCFVSEQEDAVAHAKHPFLKFPQTARGD